MLLHPKKTSGLLIGSGTIRFVRLILGTVLLWASRTNAFGGLVLRRHGLFDPTISSSTLSAFRCRSLHISVSKTRLYLSDDWSSFRSFDDDDDDLLGKVDRQSYAVEDDPQEVKAAVGIERKAPEIERDAEPIRVIPGA
jgi:hypothetical protein